MRIYFIILLLWVVFSGASQNTGVKIALLKYNGGGDWYSDPTALPNLIKYCNQNLKTNIYDEPSTIEIGSPEIPSPEIPETHNPEIQKSRIQKSI